MKNFLLGIFLMPLLATAQFEFPLDTVEFNLVHGELNDVSILIDNSASSEDLEYQWTELYRQFNPNWRVQFCDCRTCYADYLSLPEDTTVTCDGFFKLGAGNTFTGFKLQVDPENHGDGEVGYLTVEFKDFNSSATGIVTFGARFWPTGEAERNQPLSNLQIYPNPVDQGELLSLTYNYEGNDNLSARIIDLLGNEVRTIQLPVGNTLYAMQVSDLPSGVYFIQLSASGTPLATRKFVRN